MRSACRRRMVGSLSPSDLAVRAHGEAIAEVIPSASTLASATPGAMLAASAGSSRWANASRT